jgi:hypothetical protein
MLLLFYKFIYYLGNFQKNSPNEVMRLMHIVILFATEVVLLRKLGKNEVVSSKEPHS